LFHPNARYFLLAKHVLPDVPLLPARRRRLAPAPAVEKYPKIIHFRPPHFPAECCISATALAVESPYSRPEFLDRVGGRD
jgi:hypothetical protein